MRAYDGSEIFNIGTGKDITIKELAETIKEIVGFNGELTWDKTKPDGMPRKLLDVSKMQRFGWKSKVGLKSGLAETYKWYLEQDNLPQNI